ncbi:MAG: TlyA family RNA methyltransferase [Bdellovibrionia bacterium]
MKKRLDLHLHESGLAKSRSQAQQLIDAGLVSVDGRKITKSSFEVDPHAQIEIQDSALSRYVSRGGVKLEGALKRTGLSVNDLTLLDIGISTGGFTDCLLQSGAAKVYGIDVGRDQTDPKIKSDPRVLIFEGYNARDLATLRIEGPGFYDGIVIDVSFISLELVLPPAAKRLDPKGWILALVKPQFEAGRASLGKNGVVKDPKTFEEVREKIYILCEQAQLGVEDYFESDITGTDGNREFFILARPRSHR